MGKPFKPIDGRICKCGKRINRYARAVECARCSNKTEIRRLEKAGWNLKRRMRE